MVKNLLIPPKTANCDVDVGDFLLHLNDAQSMSGKLCDNALIYVAGYVCKKVLAKHSCEQ